MEDTKEIKRKFIFINNQDLSRLEKEEYERYYLYFQNGVDLRIQRVNSRYELERISQEDSTTRHKQKISISTEEFNLLKSVAKDSTQRDSYVYSTSPSIVIRIYHGKFEGLGRIEVAFENEAEMQKFTPPEWFGQEITDTPLFKDSSLLQLSVTEFAQLLAQYDGRRG